MVLINLVKDCNHLFFKVKVIALILHENFIVRYEDFLYHWFTSIIKYIYDFRVVRAPEI